jgi:hypothetical protein
VVAVGADAGAAAAVAHHRQLVDREALAAEAAGARGDEPLQLGGGGGAHGITGRGRLEDGELGVLPDRPPRAPALSASRARSPVELTELAVSDLTPWS